ncbi:MAG TPA: hypothetical protein VGP07_07640, partial [Polyangia bacterium]
MSPERPAPPARPANDLLVSIGGLVGHFALGAAPAPFIQQVRDRYGPYTVPPAAWVERAFSIAVTFTAAMAATDGELRAGEVAARPLRVDETSDSIRAARWDFSATLAARQLAGARPVWEGHASCQMNPFALDSLMRVLWAVFLPRSGGALFHACALRLGDEGVIFPGQSGAGKSTLARKVAEPERVLTDELVAVSRAELGRWRITGTPFWGDFKRGGGSIRSWPLRALSFLEQSPTLDVRHLPPAEAAWRLLGCFLCFQTDADTAARNLAIAVDLCTDLQTVLSRTARDTPFTAIEAALGPFLADRQQHDHPPTSREMISEFRWQLQQSGHYAYKPRGSSMKPWLRPGDALFIEAVAEAKLAPGDVVLYWTPGRTPHDDRLTCHRMVARRAVKGAPDDEIVA